MSSVRAVCAVLFVGCVAVALLLRRHREHDALTHVLQPNETRREGVRGDLQSKHCSALRLTSLEAVPEVEPPHHFVSASHNRSLRWLRGHFPYQSCGRPPLAAAPTRPRYVTFLMVTDGNYAKLIRPWAAQVRAAGAHCAVGDVGAAAAPTPLGANGTPPAPCVEARRAGCECFEPPVRPGTTHGALPHRAPSPRCTAESMHHVWRRCAPPPPCVSGRSTE